MLGDTLVSVRHEMLNYFWEVKRENAVRLAPVAGDHFEGKGFGINGRSSSDKQEQLEKIERAAIGLLGPGAFDYLGAHVTLPSSLSGQDRTEDATFAATQRSGR